MKTKEILLSIDAGTQSVRVLAFDCFGKLIDYAQVIYKEPYYSTHPGWAEQDPEFLWEQLTVACKRLWSQGKVLPEAILGVSVSTQRGTVINLDENGQPLRPAILWLDQRRANKLPSLGFLFRSATNLIGLKDTVDHLLKEAEINWLLEHEPETIKKTKHYLFLSGYFNYRLTGRFVDSIANQVGYVPFDYKNQTWERASHWKWKALPIHFDTLPELIPPGEILGEITEKAALETGLPKGLSVISGASDKAAELIGAGCTEVSKGGISYGTTATITVNSKQYAEPFRLLPPYPSGYPGSYNIEVQTSRGYWMVSWFKEQFAHLEQRKAAESNIPTEDLLDKLAASVEPGSMGLMLQPYWSPGIRYPGPEAKGAIIGFGSIHKKEHMYRSILEGIAYSIREGKEKIEGKTGIPMKEMYICGGGSKSNQAMQITADVLNIEVRRPSEFETAGLGAAILTAVGTKVYENIDIAIKEMTSVKEVFTPNEIARDIYNEMYTTIYTKMYRRVKPLYSQIKRITEF